MENSPEIPEIKPSLMQLFKGVLDEDYSAFFMCTEDYTASVLEHAATENDHGRAELLNEVAIEAVNYTEGERVKPFLDGEFVFLKGVRPEMLDVTIRQTEPNVNTWYIQLSRPDIAYLYYDEKISVLEKVYSIYFGDSLQ